MSKPSVLVVISYFDGRPAAPLRRLLASMARHPAGGEYDIAVVVNRAGGGSRQLGLNRPDVRVHERANTGMNIGAWDHGWRSDPGYAHYLFLQDDCLVAREGWLAAYLSRAADPHIGLLGEALNPAWDKSWEKLAKERAGEVMPDHTLGGAPVERVALYLDFMRRAEIDPGEGGRHLRSLTWFARRDVLERIGGFPIGANYGECIAAEIAVSRNIVAAGLRVEQVARDPFHFIRHADWAQATPGGPYLHARSRKEDFMSRLSRLWRR
jgi:hypothetical protein